MRTKSKNTKIQNVEHAITLLALIITVIVLLILATVSISLIINSGILDHAQQGVDRYSEEEELEQIKLAVASARLKGNGFLTTENLNNELQDKFGDGTIPGSNGWRFKDYNIKENGEVNKSLLPAEYQQVEYIGVSSNKNSHAYINTKLKGGNSSEYKISLGMNKKTDNVWQQIFARTKTKIFTCKNLLQ